MSRLKTGIILIIIGPIETYEYPVTTSHNYGWWIKQGGHAPKWAQNAKHVHVNSEMTRYVYIVHVRKLVTCMYIVHVRKLVTCMYIVHVRKLVTCMYIVHVCKLVTCMYTCM